MQVDLIKDLILIFIPAIVFVIVFYLLDWFFTRDAIVKGGEV